LDARLTALLCKQIIVAKFKEVKIGWSIDTSGRFFKGRLWLKMGCFANDDDNFRVRTCVVRVLERMSSDGHFPVMVHEGNDMLKDQHKDGLTKGKRKGP
jgi:hypothetical protein